MATVDDTVSFPPSLMGRLTSTQNSNRGSWHRRSAPSFKTHETPEVVKLGRLIVEQNAALDERRRRIEAMEQQIEEYERRIHYDRCAQDGYDYVQRAYNLLSYDNDDFVNGHRQVATEGTLAVYYQQASNEIQQRLVDVEAQLVDIANDCRTLTSAECDDGKSFRQLEEFDRSAGCDVDWGAQLVVDGNAHRRRALQLDALRLELESADDIRRQQLVEHLRLSSAVENADSQLSDEEQRLDAMLAVCEESSASPYVSTDIRELCQPLKSKSTKFQTGEYQRHLERSLKITQRSYAVPDVSAAIASTSPDITQLNDCGKSRDDSMCITSVLCQIDTYSDIVTSHSALESARCCSFTDEDDLVTERHPLVTLV